MQANITYSTPEGGNISFKSFRALASFISRRQQVTWTRSVRMDDEHLADPEARNHAATLLAFAQSANMFPDRNGNCSWRGSHLNTLMWNHSAMQEHIAKLREWYKERLTIVDPVSKLLACGDEGVGAFASIDDIVKAVHRALS